MCIFVNLAYKVVLLFRILFFFTAEEIKINGIDHSNKQTFL